MSVIPSAPLPPAAPPGASAQVLALASSGTWTSVALLRQTPAGLACDCRAEPAGPDQSARLFALIDELLAGRPLQTLDAVAFDAGPGAFTGLRIGCAVAQGLGFAQGLPLVGVGSLEAAAWRSLRRSGHAQALALVANDARMSEIYASVCRLRLPRDRAGLPAVEVLAGPVVCGPDGLPSALAGVLADPALAGLPRLAAGDAWARIGLPEAWQHAVPDAALQAAAAGSAREVAELALPIWRAGGGVPAEAAVPHYVRDKVALDVDEQRQLRAQRQAVR